MRLLDFIRAPYVTPWTPRDSRRDALEEQARQIEKWGVQSHPDGTNRMGDVMRADTQKRFVDLLAQQGRVTWRDILEEEVAEAFAEPPNSGRLRNELVQVAAVALSWVDDIDSRNAG